MRIATWTWACLLLIGSRAALGQEFPPRELAEQPVEIADERLPTPEDRLAELEKKVAELSAPPPLPALPSVKLGGVFQADAGWFSQDANSRLTVGDIQDGVDFRRARLSANGNVSEQMSYFFQMDFGFFGRPTFTDVWLAFNDVPVFGNIKIGQWKHPFSLEVVSSFRYTTFMERSLLFQPFTPFRHLGIGFYNWSDDLSTTWAASAIRTGQDQFGATVTDTSGYGVVGRLTHLLYYDEPSDGRYYTHIGGGYYFNAPPNDSARFRTIPEFFVGEFAGGPVGTSGQAVPNTLNGAPFFVDTGVFAANNINTFGTELLWVHGPLSLQSEMMCAVVDRAGGSSIALPGGYAQVGIFLTGEHRPYDRKAGAIDRIKPFEDFFWVRDGEGRMQHGSGAVELAGRISYINLNADNVRGGELTDLTFGVNWYLNPYAKLVFNYIHAFLDDPARGNSDTDIVAVRAQLDF
jgi:phosphate-selective porin OprO/OprP